MSDTALWRAAIATLQKVEGGYVNHPSDPGGETNHGISKRSYPHLDIANLTKVQAADIAKRDFWRHVPTDLPDDVRFFAFDIAFHHGLGRMREWLAIDKTLPGLVARRIHFLSNLATYDAFGKGWMRRVATVLADIAKYEAEHGTTGTGDTLVLHNMKLAERWAALATSPVVLRGSFVWRQRGSKLDLRKD